MADECSRAARSRRTVGRHGAKEHHRQVLEQAPAGPANSAEVLAALGRDFPRVWNHPDADARLQKRILRAAIHEILVKPSDDGLLLQVTIHWQGGVHTQCTVDRPVRQRERSNKTIVELVTGLAVDLDDRDLARVLNMNGTTTPGGLRWTQDRVRDYRKQQRIHAPAADRNRDSMTMNQVQTQLGVSHNPERPEPLAAARPPREVTATGRARG